MTAPLNRSNAVLIVGPLFSFEIYGYVAYNEKAGCPRNPKGCPTHRPLLFLNIIRLKFAIAVELNDHGTVLRGNKMRYTGRNEDETARGVPFQLGGVEFRSLAQIPGSFDDGDRFVLRVRMREDTFAGGNLDTIDPRSALT